MPPLSLNSSSTIYFSKWTFVKSQNLLTDTTDDTKLRLEPKVSTLLHTLLIANGEVVKKEHITSEVWPNVTISDDTLAKTISRLRTTLNDSAQNPAIIETIPKVGYRMLVKRKAPFRTKMFVSILLVCCGLLLATVSSIVLKRTSSEADEITEVLVRADNLYMQYSEPSNEAALVLYETILEKQPNNVKALAGKANAMLQRLVRWPTSVEINSPTGNSLSEALANGQLDSLEAKLIIERARLIAEKAVSLSPDDVIALKALGLAYSAEGKIKKAISIYQSIMTLDHNAWRSLVNLSELYTLNQQLPDAIETFQKAYFAMQASHIDEPQTIGIWQPAIGIMIANLHVQTGNELDARNWAQRVFELVPFHPEASTIYVQSLIRDNQHDLAEEFCDDYSKKLLYLTPCKPDKASEKLTLYN